HAVKYSRPPFLSRIGSGDVQSCHTKSSAKILTNASASCLFQAAIPWSSIRSRSLFDMMGHLLGPWLSPTFTRTSVPGQIPSVRTICTTLTASAPLVAAMTCTVCGTDNRATAKFCRQCGSPLARVCPNGHPVEADATFCDECGAAIDVGPARRDAPAPASERRLVTVLFADLVGFTSRSEDQDPDEVRDFLSRYFDTCRTLIRRYGGTVEKFIGDAVMAVWGTPTAQEDDAERGVRAALDLVQAVSE